MSETTESRPDPAMRALIGRHVEYADRLRTQHTISWTLFGVGMLVLAVIASEAGPESLVLSAAGLLLYVLYTRKRDRLGAALATECRQLTRPRFGDDHRAARDYIETQKRLSGCYEAPRGSGRDPQAWLTL
ncbi:hypothetical protein J2T57_001473 [Natronocella acetinitrilica]|uniref:Uncharacterized protein n=1 Tax=Natronocella acetinitrilica TaxID=414046 RepID=A0AAE3G255_9GAMM|nr:UbiA family prenyltransferase [Natronocella acetinitrilica]MCP1674371.1 hypothetical protein [Natronocella acetinitrilica]